MLNIFGQFLIFLKLNSFRIKFEDANVAFKDAFSGLLKCFRGSGLSSKGEVTFQFSCIKAFFFSWKVICTCLLLLSFSVPISAILLNFSFLPSNNDDLRHSLFGPHLHQEAHLLLHSLRISPLEKHALFDAGIKHVLSDQKPTDPSPESSSKPLEQWLSDDQRSRSIILFAMDDLLFDAYSNQETSKQIMDSLTKIFDPTNGAYRYNLYHKYSKHKMAEETPINEHLLEMRAMAIDLEHAGMSIPEGFQKILILNSLPDSLQSARLNIDLNRIESLEDVMRRLRVEGEVLKMVTRDAEESESESDRKRQRSGNKEFRGNCYNCGKPGHCRSNCPDKVKN